MSRTLALARRLSRVAAAALALAAGAGCGAGADATAPPGVTGSWVLSTINDQPLPFTLFEQPGERLVITLARVELGADGRFTDETTVRNEFDGTVTTEVDRIVGTYERSGDLVLFRETGTGYRYRMAVTGDALVQTSSIYGVTYAFKFTR